MTGTDAASGRATALTLAVIVTMGAVAAVPGLVLFAQPAAADAPGTVAVAQGTNCWTVEPAGDGSQSVEDFYDYRNPETSNESGNSTYSSFGTQAFQETGTSSLFFYDGANGTSLVVVHGEVGDEAGGSTITWSVSGLSSGGDLAVQDDYYESGTQDDNFDYQDGDATAQVDWMYSANRTDGAAFRGLAGSDFDTVTIDPGYNEAADFWGDWRFSGVDEYRIDAWNLRGPGGSTVGELALDRRVFVHHAACGSGSAPSAAVDGPGSTSAGETVTLDASGTTDADSDTAGYEWDFDGDGTVEQTTTTPTVTHTYTSGGNYTATVTAYDEYANTGTATTRVNVSVVDAPPTAQLSAPDSAVVGESVTLDASASTDENGSIAGYEWDFDGDGTVEQTTTSPTVTHNYSTAGDYQPSVTVVDDAGNSDDASATVTVSPPNESPTAALSAPGNVTAGESVEFDASGTTDDQGIVEYRWHFDPAGDVNDGDPPDSTTTTPTTTHAFPEAGTYVVSVVVADADGATDEATAEVVVESAPVQPTAALSVPESATANESVTLDASASTPADAISEYRWDFDGDGTTDTTTESPTVTHRYASSGEYEPAVTVVTTAGQSDAATGAVSVTAPEEPPAFTAAVSTPTDDPTAGSAVTFDASESTPADAIVAYEWSFGDGATATGETVEHVYDTAGTYDGTLTVRGEDGTADTTSFEIVVGEADSGGGGDSGSGDSGSGDSGSGDSGSGGDSGGGSSGGGSGSSGGSSGGGSSGGGSSGGTSGGGASSGGSSGSSGGGSGGGSGDGGSGSASDSGSPQASFTTGSLNATSPELVAGEDATFAVEVANTGNASGTTSVAFTVNGTTWGMETVELEPGERTTVTFSHQFDEAGTYAVATGDAAATQVAVESAEPSLSVTDVSTGAESVVEGGLVNVTATVRNDGHAAGSMQLELELFDEVVAVQTVSVAPGETRTVSFTRRLSAAGTYTASVASENVTVTVLADEDASPTTTRTTYSSPTQMPGFTTLGALAAVLVALAVAVARRER